MTEGTLSAEELDRLEARARDCLRSKHIRYVAIEPEAVLALVDAAREVPNLIHDIGRHMDALLAADEALHKEREECARIADERAKVADAKYELASHGGNEFAQNVWGSERRAACDIAAAIRSRTQETSNG